MPQPQTAPRWPLITPIAPAVHTRAPALPPHRASMPPPTARCPRPWPDRCAVPALAFPSARYPESARPPAHDATRLPSPRSIRLNPHDDIVPPPLPRPPSDPPTSPARLRSVSTYEAYTATRSALPPQTEVSCTGNDDGLKGGIGLG
eukprot:XP_023157871.1 proline-rich receptor-like protein kinase PERK9 [Zea mays]